MVEFVQSLLADPDMERAKHEVEGIAQATSYTFRFTGLGGGTGRSVKQLLEAQRVEKCVCCESTLSLRQQAQRYRCIITRTSQRRLSRATSGSGGCCPTCVPSTLPSTLCVRASLKTLWQLAWALSSGWCSAALPMPCCNGVRPLWKSMEATEHPLTRRSPPTLEQGQMCNGKNRCLPPLAAGKVCSVSLWNARGLMHHRKHNVLIFVEASTDHPQVALFGFWLLSCKWNPEWQVASREIGSRVVGIGIAVNPNSKQGYDNNMPIHCNAMDRTGAAAFRRCAARSPDAANGRCGRGPAWCRSKSNIWHGVDMSLGALAWRPKYSKVGSITQCGIEA